ncbi:interleukin-12 receptor subunit beta-1 [Phycodurus eques]|uniref:interleukin-12 receptor subunit beta-1 n=1 Tax=Phycodurus eques TaxID=693459 RepID=UPI002ACEC4E0|nr:interleukin-12 receptor subunit beta-1 [Phycodurus eques]
METLGWNSPLRYIAMLLIFPTTSSKGSECEAPSSPQCFRRNNEETIYECEWQMNTTQRNVTFDLHFSSDIRFENIQETRKQINDEDLIKYKHVDIWVEAQAGESVCTSTSTSVILSETVKFEAPQDISVAWFQNHLKVTWNAAEKYPALAEVWFQIDETKPWEKRLNTTQFTHSQKAYQLLVENLQKHTSYQLKLRHRTKVTRNPLWSDWSSLVIVPAELEDKMEVNVTLERLEGARKVTLIWKPVHHAAAVPEVNYILRDTQSSRGCPCMVETHPSNRTEYTDYVSYSPVNFSVIARNAAGSSPTAIIHIPAEPTPNLKPCNKTLLDKKLNKTTCLEWYKQQDGDLRLVARKTKRDMKRFTNSIEDYVGYIYFEHMCINERPKTVQMCLFYKNENVPKIAPQDLFTYNETHSSASLSWKAIPTEDRRGFLTQYNVCSVQIISEDEHYHCHSVPASSVEYHLDNLTPVTKYITVAGVTRAGEGPKATVTFSTRPMNPMKEWFKLAVVMAFLFIFLLIVCTCVWKRMKKKMLPPVPKPVIWDFASYPTLKGEKLEKEDEVVHDVTLQQLQPKEHGLSEDAEEPNMSLNIFMKRTRVSYGSSDDPLRPSAIQQTLRGSKEEEMPCMEQEDMLGLLLYRKGLVFDMKTDEC